MPAYLVFDANGNYQGSGYASDALPLPDGATPCTVAQLDEAPLLALQNGVIVSIQPPAPTLADAQAAQTAILQAAYENAIIQPVTYTTVGGVTKVFQADTDSQNILLQSFTGFNAAGGVPTGFYWKSQDNTEVPFTLADLKGLFQAMLGQGWTAFQHNSTQKAAVASATTIAAVQAITW